jgi:hypothetical protein
VFTESVNGSTTSVGKKHAGVAGPVEELQGK